MQIKLAWSAFKNMLKAAARDPLWAITRILFSPFTGGKHLLESICAVVLSGVILFFIAQAVIPPDFTFQVIVNTCIVIFMVLLAFRLMTNPLINHFGNLASDDTHGTARFSANNEITPLTQNLSGLMIGRDPESAKSLYYNGPAHLLTMAPTRTGKGVGTIIPNLLTANRSVICIDPKGENAMIAGRARNSFGPVHILDPFGITGKPSAAYNPVDALNLDGLDIAEDANALADALIYDEPGAASEAHWNEEAKALITGIILHIVAHEPRNRRTLSSLRECLTLPPETFAALLKTMQNTQEAGGLIARAANRHLGKSDREGSGVLSTAQRHTHFLDSPRMTKVLARSDFSFADLKRHTGSIFLVLPPDRLNTYSRWLRLLVTQSLTDMTRSPERPENPVLYLLDEFAALGQLDAVEQAMSLMAGYGVQLWPILQDIHQLRATYGQRAGTFLSNAAVLQVFGVNDHESARLVSDLLGQETTVFQTMGRALDSEKSGISFGEQHTARPLLTPDEVRNLPEHVQLLFLTGQRPIIAQKLSYYRDSEFSGMFDQQL